MTFDSTVKFAEVPLVTDGFLQALHDDSVIRLAGKYGDPVDLLEGRAE